MAGWVGGQVAIVGVGESQYYKHGHAPTSEFQLCLDAIFNAANDAGVDVHDIDGFSSYADERNDAMRIAHALNLNELKYSVMQWGGGGAGCMAAIGNAAAGVIAGHCDYVIVHRAIAQGQFGRYGKTAPMAELPGEYSYVAPYGLLSAAQIFSFRMHRFIHEFNVSPSALRAVAMTCYRHAQNNPRAVMYGRSLTEEQYNQSRWITEPLHLYDICQESDGAAALIITSMERARHLKKKPVAVVGAASGSQRRQGSIGGGISYHNAADYATANMKGIAARLYAMSGLAPSDVDVVQCYDHFSGAVIMALVEHELCRAEQINSCFTVENLSAPGGELPLNTSGGNLAEGYVHGLSLVNEAVRQLRGESVNQVPGARVALCIGGAMGAPASNLMLSGGV